MASYKIEGLQTVKQNLARVPAIMVAQCFTNALDRASGVIEAEIAARAPEDNEGEYYSSTKLRDHIVHRIQLDLITFGGRAFIGFDHTPDERTGIPQDLKALLVEYGHRQVGHKPESKELGTVPAHPFIRPALTAAYERAVEVFVQTFKENLEKIHF